MAFSRSPFIAFAVSAMIGSPANCGIRRIAVVVAYPSISGIMMSISTTATSSCCSSTSMPSRPFSAYSTDRPCCSRTLVSAKTLRMSSSTISTFCPAKRMPRRGVRAACGSCSTAGHSSSSAEGRWSCWSETRRLRRNSADGPFRASRYEVTSAGVSTSGAAGSADATRSPLPAPAWAAAGSRWAAARSGAAAGTG